LDQALATPDIQVRLFGKPEVAGERRVGVALALAQSVEAARSKASAAANAINVVLG
jgi:phosphoribosylglycinamide formyltransferase 2